MRFRLCIPFKYKRGTGSCIGKEAGPASSSLAWRGSDLVSGQRFEIMEKRAGYGIAAKPKGRDTDMRTIHIRILYDNGIEKDYAFDSSEELTPAEMEIAIRELKEAYVIPAFRGEKTESVGCLTFESEGRDISINLAKVAEVAFSIR